MAPEDTGYVRVVLGHPSQILVHDTKRCVFAEECYCPCTEDEVL